MAELLVRAKSHWMDSLSQNGIDMLSNEEKQSYNGRSQIGDIIVVRPDGWKWGKEECLPNYIIIKISDLKYEDAKKYEDPLTENRLNKQNKMSTFRLKRRKYQIPKSVIDTAKLLSQNSINISSGQKDTFIANIIKKVKNG